MKINVGVFFGGKSVEHEVSVITAIEAMNAMDKNKYKVIPIYITKEGEFYTSDLMFDVKSFKNIPELLDKSTNVTVSLNEREHSILNNESGLFMKRVIDKLDVAFPIMHGTNGEDGTIQGLFELMNIPYVGSNVVASANGMDKITMKMILKETGLPVVDYLWFFSNTYFNEKEKILNSIESSIGFPVVVKPANLGSSVGIGVAKNIIELEEAIDTATSFSTKIIVEKMVQNLKEINCSVLGDVNESYVSVCEEPIMNGDFLSYADKYGTGSKSSMANSYHKLPAEIPDEMANTIKKLAKMTFITLNCSGVARIDFLVDAKSGEIFVNEINTIPGSLSYYLWEATGLKFNDLIDKLIEFAIKKNKEKNKLIFTNNINILSIKSKSGKVVNNEEKVNDKNINEKNNNINNANSNSNSNNVSNINTNSMNVNVNNMSQGQNVTYNMNQKMNQNVNQREVQMTDISNNNNSNNINIQNAHSNASANEKKANNNVGAKDANANKIFNNVINSIANNIKQGTKVINEIKNNIAINSKANNTNVETNANVNNSNNINNNQSSNLNLQDENNFMNSNLDNEHFDNQISLSDLENFTTDSNVNNEFSNENKNRVKIKKSGDMSSMYGGTTINDISGVNDNRININANSMGLNIQDVNEYIKNDVDGKIK